MCCVVCECVVEQFSCEIETYSGQKAIFSLSFILQSRRAAYIFFVMQKNHRANNNSVGYSQRIGKKSGNFFPDEFIARGLQRESGEKRTKLCAAIAFTGQITLG